MNSIETAKDLGNGIYSKQEINDLVYSKESLNGAIGNINNPLLDLPLNNSLAMKQGVGSVTFSRGTTGTYVDRYGVLKTAAIDEPRFEKDGLLIEGASTNLLTNSDITLVDTKNGGNVVDIHDIPFFTNGVYISDNSVSSYAYKSPSLTKGNTYTLSVFMVMDDLSIPKYATDFALVIEGAAIYDDYTITEINKELGLYRVSTTFTSSNGGGNFGVVKYTNYSPTGIKVTGYQLEELSFASSYIPTGSSTVTRGAENCYATFENNDVHYLSASTIMFDHKTLGRAANYNRYPITLSSDSWRFAVGTTLDNKTYLYRNGVYSNTTNVILPYNSMYRIAMVDDRDNMHLYSDGLLLTSVASSSNRYYVTNKIYLGRSPNFTAWFGYIKNFRTYDKALSSQEIALA